jgi:hypothetical protein
MSLTETELIEFDQVCATWNKLYAKLERYPKEVLNNNKHIALFNQNHFKYPIAIDTYFLEQMTLNCGYKKHKITEDKYVCESCNLIMKSFTNYPYYQMRICVRGGSLKYESTDLIWKESLDDPYLLKSYPCGDKATLLVKSVWNLQGLRKQIVALEQIITVEKARKECLFWIRMKRYICAYIWITTRMGLPMEIVKKIFLLVVL